MRSTGLRASSRCVAWLAQTTSGRCDITSRRIGASPPGWVPIALSDYGDYTVISVLPDDYGHIYYLFHEVHCYDSSNRTEGVYHLANSFSEWINGLAKLTKDH